MVCLKIIHLNDQLWTVIAELLSVLILADLFYSPDFILYGFKNIIACQECIQALNSFRH